LSEIVLPTFRVVLVDWFTLDRLKQNGQRHPKRRDFVSRCVKQQHQIFLLEVAANQGKIRAGALEEIVGGIKACADPFVRLTRYFHIFPVK